MPGKGPEEGAKPDKAAEKAAKKIGGLFGGLNPGMIAAGIALLLVATMGSAFLAVTFLGKTVSVSGASTKAEGETKAKEESQFGPTQEIGNFTVNLADPGERVFVKAGVSVELNNAEAGAELTSRDPQVKDIVIGVLSSRTMADVSSFEGKEALKKELTEKINRLLSKGKVRSVFFTEFVFQ